MKNTKKHTVPKYSITMKNDENTSMRKNHTNTKPKQKIVRNIVILYELDFLYVYKA